MARVSQLQSLSVCVKHVCPASAGLLRTANFKIVEKAIDASEPSLSGLWHR